MKRLLEMIKKAPSLVALALVGLFFFPSALAAPPEGVTSSIVTAIGIDKEDEEYEVTLLAFLSYPNQTYLEKYETFSSTGNTLSEAFAKAGMQIGKTISLFHTSTAVVSEKMVESEDIAPSLDYLARVASLPQSCLLVSTNQKAKTFLDFIQKLDEKSDINLEEIGFYTSNYINWNDTTINSFLQGYYSPSNCSTINYLPLVEGDVNGIAIDEAPDDVEDGGESESSSGTGIFDSGESEGGDGSQGGSTQKSGDYELVNNRSEMILKNGKKQKILSSEIVDGLNWFNSKVNGQLVILDDFNDGNYTNSKFVYQVVDKQIRQKPIYEDGHPVLLTNIRVFLSLSEIDGHKAQLEKNYEENYISPEVRKRVEEFVKKQIADAISVLREEQSDVLGFYESFYKFKRSETKKYLKTLENEQDFFENITHKVVVNVFPS